MVWLRTRPLSDDDVTIEVKRRRWYYLWLFATWEEKSTARSAVNKKEWEIIELCAKIEKKFAERMALADAAEAQWEDSRSLAKSNYGISRPFELDDKDFKDRIADYTERPDDNWIQFFSPNIIRKYALARKARSTVDPRGNPRRAGDRAHGRPIYPGSSGVAAYTLDEYANKSIHLAEESGVDQVIAFKEQDQKGDANRKEQMKKLRADNPRRQGESDGDWNNRLQAMLKEQTNNG